MKRIFRQIHLWLSVPFGLIITVVCFSGAALVFENEIMELCHRDLYYVKKVEAVPLPMDELLTKVTATLPDSVAVMGVTVSAEPERAYQVNLSKPRRTSIYVDQYTGEVKGKSGRTPFFLTMFKLHRWLLDGMKPDGGIFWGKMIVGSATLMLVFVLVSGIFIWLPRSKKALKNSLKLVTGKGQFRLWHSLHVAGGMYTVLFLLVMALTGLTWSFSWYRTGFYKVFGVETQQGGGHGAAASSAHGGGKSEGNSHGKSQEDRSRSNGGQHEGREGERPSPYAHWQQVYNDLKMQNPRYKQIALSKDAATVSFDGWGNQRATDRYTFNPRSGEITETTLYQDADRSGKIRGWIYSVHVGNWGGMFTRILTFIAALLGATLPLTGYYLWWRRLRRKGKVMSAER